MRILGLDVGTKTIGVALSDPLGLTAQGLTTIRRRDLEQDLAELGQLAATYEADTLLVGLPLNMNGSAGPSVDMARALGEAAGARLGLPVVYRDERLSTVAAERALLEGDLSRKKRRQVIDKMAAVFVLQGYLDQLAAERSRSQQTAVDERPVTRYNLKTGAIMAANTGGNKMDDKLDLGPEGEVEDDIITLIDEDDNEIDFHVEDFVDLDGKRYVVLSPCGDEEAEDGLILRFETDPETGEDLLSDIEDDDEWNRVADAYTQSQEEADQE